MTGYQDIPLWCNPALIGHLTLIHDIFLLLLDRIQNGIKINSNQMEDERGTSPALESSEGTQTSKKQIWSHQEEPGYDSHFKLKF